MCQRLGDAELFALELQRREAAHLNLEQARRMVAELAELAAMRQAIIRGATYRIAELECQAGFAATTPPQ